MKRIREEDRLARIDEHMMAVGQHKEHAVHVGESIPVPTWPASPLPGKNGIVRSAGKSIVQMLLRRHRMTAGGPRDAYA